MVIKEIQAKSILSKSQVFTYALNAYTGCEHACSYCYARFMKRFSGHREAWGQFVDVKVNAPELLKKEVHTKKPGKVWVSGVCDPYQPLEAQYQITRRCLQILAENHWPVVIQTRSPLVLRDMDVFGKDFDVGLSIATADDHIRQLFEPNAPPISKRLDALRKMHQTRIKTYAMIAPILPGVEELPDLLVGEVDYVILDRMNYHHADWVYRKYNLQDKMTDEYFQRTVDSLTATFTEYGIRC